MKRALIVIAIILLILSDCSMYADSFIPASLTPEETQWLKVNKNKIYTLGLDPYAGIEFFYDGDHSKGYMLEFTDYLNEELGLTIEVVDDLSWGAVYNGLHSGEIDLLFGANPTEERMKTMSFTNEINSVPYAILASKNGTIRTVGDIDNKKVGFIDSDIVIDLFQQSYNKINYEPIIFEDQYHGLEALENQEIEAFITAGGEILYDYSLKYPNTIKLTDLDDIRSKLTISALNENKMLLGIIEKVIIGSRPEIDRMIKNARQAYIRMILDLTPQEKAWLESEPSVRVGVATDYLPIDYYENGNYGGIAGYYLSNFSELLGIRLEAVPGTFEEVYAKALLKQVDVLNMAISEERKASFIFTAPFSDERDIIYGDNKSPYVFDTYGLEGKRVAVIDGFWHEEYLNKNLRNVTIVNTPDIQTSIAKVDSGEADYFIETPAVADYYIHGLGYSNIQKKGDTPTDSFLYFGVQKELGLMVSIFNKSKRLISYDEAKYYGMQGLPVIENIENIKLRNALIISGLFLALLFVILYHIITKLIRQNTDLLLLRERERLIYIDPLTGLFNRNHFNQLDMETDTRSYPQYVIAFDINDLKLVNDEFGHLVGDQLIIKFSELLKDASKPFDAIRMGGDEFLVWIESGNEVQAKIIMQKIRIGCKHISLVKDDEEVKTGISVAMGYGVRENEEISIDQCLQTADEAMYIDKERQKRREKL
ncbi:MULTISPECIES: diguanylate cyclase domain-containing protein [unclassified Fusibacter]|uniref:transporter substrate-binding domain-containing diguanylate cyclase n=1 Tax=unclassified Fusibacter TaxID=2624464 RepID=UPI0010114750|nr:MULTISPECIES: transporter substrate-binding domain-containing protein [unclassified Fusibacter]MCK8060121.1 transporter substrate-binding domain-containing protein [Fusibacter sp. A2]NPE22263.1 transporter substrate-binding domain-containing protein [Fusibacter sp. A1]RXV61037.1 diguanylate cyclase [Fusibacter sp. A1]